MDVSDRRMQVQLTQEAKIASDFFFIGAIFAVVGDVNGHFFEKTEKNQKEKAPSRRI